MDVLGGGLWIPPGIVQHIQDKDPSLRLCYVCKDIKINRVQWGIDKLSGKKLNSKLLLLSHLPTPMNEYTESSVSEGSE